MSPTRRPRWITAQQLAAIWGVSTMTIYRMAKKGEIPSIRVGRAYRFDPEAVEAAFFKGPMRKEGS